MSAYSDYKARLGTTRPWDFLDPNIEQVDKDVATARYAICKGCPELTITKQCKLCGCFMKAKTRLKDAKCPIGKWV